MKRKSKNADVAIHAASTRVGLSEKAKIAGWLLLKVFAVAGVIYLTLEKIGISGIFSLMVKLFTSFM